MHHSANGIKVENSLPDHSLFFVEWVSRMNLTCQTPLQLSITDNSQLFKHPMTTQVAMAMQRRQMLTRATEERLRAENRKWEYQREDHMRMVAQDRLLRANMASDERVEKKRCVYMHVCVHLQHKMHAWIGE